MVSGSLLRKPLEDTSSRYGRLRNTDRERERYLDAVDEAREDLSSASFWSPSGKHDTVAEMYAAHMSIATVSIFERSASDNDS